MISSIEIRPQEIAAVDRPGAIRTGVGRHRHVGALMLAGIAIALSFVLTIRPDGRVAPRFFPSWAVPETCPAHALFHISCPGCGLTRSCICVAQAHWKLSLRYHRLGWVMAIAILLQIPYRTVCIRRGFCPGLPAGEARWIGFLLVAALLVNWGLDLV